MGIAYRLEPTLRLTLVVWDGTVTSADWRTHVETVLADPEWPPGTLNLTDVTTITDSSVTDDDQDYVVDLYRPHAAQLVGMRSAVIASDQFDSSTNFGQRMQPVGVNLVTFNALAVACTWLGIDAGTVAPILRDLRRQLR